MKGYTRAGKKKRVKLAQNKWGQCVYQYGELVQIRNWLKSHLWRERGSQAQEVDTQRITM